MIVDPKYGLHTVVSIGDPTFGETSAEHRTRVIALGLNTTNYFLYTVGGLVIFFLILESPLIIARFKARHEPGRGWFPFLTESPGVSKVGRSVEITSPLRDGNVPSEKTGMIRLESPADSPAEIRSATWDIVNGQSRMSEKGGMPVQRYGLVGEGGRESEMENEAWESLMNGQNLGSRFPAPPSHNHVRPPGHGRQGSFHLDPKLNADAPRKPSGGNGLHQAANGVSPFRSRLEEIQRQRGVQRKESYGSLHSTTSSLEHEKAYAPGGNLDDEARDEMRDQLKQFPPRIVIPNGATRNKRISELTRKTSWASLAGSVGSDADEEEMKERAYAAVQSGHQLGYSQHPSTAFSDQRKPGAPHGSNLTSYLPFSNKILLSTPFPRLPNTTVAHFLILALYTSLVAICSFWNSNLSFDTVTNPAGPDYYRTADICMAQIPIVMMLGPRNTLIKWMFANGRDVILIKVHKISGRTLALGAVIHTALYFRHWTMVGTFGSNSATPNIIAAYIATFGLLLIVFTSIPFFRGAYHRVFKSCHWLGIGLFFVGLLYHVDTTRFPYIFAGVAILLVDTIMKVAKTKVTTAEMKVIPEAGTTIVTMPKVKGGFKAGQYVIIRIPAVCRTAGMQGLEGHPFSVASAPGRDGGLTLMIKKAGDWTDALYAVTNKNQKMNPERGTSMYSTRVIVEGPYGGQGNENLASFSSVILVAGGSGITAPLSLCQDLLDKAERGVSVRARIIDFIFIVRTQEIARPFMPTLLALVEKAKRMEGSSSNAVRVHIYVTRCPASSPIDLLPMNALEDDSTSMSKFSGIKIKSQRPDMRAVLNDAVDTVVRAKWKIQADTGKPAFTHGCGVVVCGPGPVVTMCRDAVRDVNETKRTQIGGIDLMEEGFAL